MINHMTRRIACLIACLSLLLTAGACRRDPGEQPAGSSAPSGSSPESGPSSSWTDGAETGTTEETADKGTPATRPTAASSGTRTSATSRHTAGTTQTKPTGAHTVTTYYVDVGKGKDSNDGSAAKPFASISQASFLAQAGDTILVRAGTYRETVSVAGGEKGKPLTIRAEKGAAPVITGADVIEASWSVYKGHIYVANVREEVANLFVDDRQMLLARWPNAEVDNLVHMNRATMQAGSDSRTLADTNLPQGNLTGARVNMVPGSEYNAHSRLIKSYTPGVRLTFDRPVSSSGNDPEGFDPFVPKAGNPYYLVGALDLLDAPGEWYYDSGAKKLYLYTEKGDSPAKHVVSYQTRTVGLDLKSASYAVIGGLRLVGCAVDGRDAENCVLDGVHVTYGDYFLDSNGYDSMSNQNNNLCGKNNVWKNSRIAHAAGNGLYLGGSNNTVENCIIADIAWSAGYFGAVTVKGRSNAVKNCTLYDSGRFLIYHSDALQTVIRNNELYGAALLTSDCGAVYAWGTASEGTEIAYNYVHDNRCTGIYADNNCADMKIHHNIVVKNKEGVRMNSPFLKGSIVNNTFAGNEQLSGCYAYPGETPSMRGSLIANNLFEGNWDLVTGANAPALKNNVRAGTLEKDYTLPAGHPGIDAGALVAPLTDGYKGAAPDAGAVERGDKVFSYGADW